MKHRRKYLGPSAFAVMMSASSDPSLSKNLNEKCDKLSTFFLWRQKIQVQENCLPERPVRQDGWTLVKDCFFEKS